MSEYDIKLIDLRTVHPLPKTGGVLCIRKSLIEARKTPSGYVTRDTSRINSSKLLKLIERPHHILMEYQVYCLEEDVEKAEELLKDRIRQNIDALFTYLEKVKTSFDKGVKSLTDDEYLDIFRAGT